MGSTVFFGYTTDKSLHVTLNRGASDALESLIDDALQQKYPELHEKIMEMLPLDQINFVELNNHDFNAVIGAIRQCISSWDTPTESQLRKKKIWEEEAEPLVILDPRYN
ncbi:hypothetical protein R6Y99_10095 [Pseudomonas lundensis]|uniref:hypothetical protein n=1 Tax=Serratia proteamaculans TaxID=28151 RepID=UPI002980D0BD|nr:hypothetical protein [Serratia proteamaculans]MDW5500138.1 hypothetical protein [Serratia proteamaculans]MDW5505204.1 hypothetical protein [Pseudomonas lundensis]